MQLVDKDAVAARGKISKRTLDRLIAAGRGPRVTRFAGIRRTLFRTDDVDEWIERMAKPEEDRAA